MGDEFAFDEQELNAAVNSADLAELDKQFLASMQAKTAASDSEDSNEAFTFWFLIVVLLIFVFFIVLGVIMVVKGRQRRREYVLVGYRRP